MSKSLEALKHLYAKLSCKSSIEEIDENLQEYEIIEKDLEVLEILREKQVDLWLVDNCDYENYVRIRNNCQIDTKVYCDDGAVVDYTITKEEFELVQNWLDEGE